MIMKNKAVKILYDFSSVMLTAIVTVGVIFTFIFKISTVVGESMENTLLNGDTLAITAITPSVKSGDVVVISQPNAYEKVLIKRVIAVGGQTISFDRAGGCVLVDGKRIDEPYIKEVMHIYGYFDKTYTIGEGQLFVMGDNRNESADSRDPHVGLIDERYVVGKVFYRFGDKNLFEIN